ncbi:MAG: hypothetical protein RLZZ58_985, partial [Pseudomonadota bacterium]
PLLEQQGAFHAAYWTMAKEQGWTALALPAAYGGLDLGLIEMGLIALEIGRTLAGAPFVTGGYGTARAILCHGDAATRDAWLPRLAIGDAIGAVALADGQASLGHTAVALSGGTLTGTKAAVSGGLHAHVGLILAHDAGIPVLAIADLTGVTRTSFATFDNSRCCADLTFAGTPAAVLARGNDAMAAALTILAELAVMTAYEQTGGAEVLMERARDYALTRKAFGQPIGAFQSVKHRIAEMYGLVELARAGALHAATRVGHADFVRAAAAARLSATEAYDTAARDCVQVHGGIGVTWEGGLHLHMRRARTLAIEQGNMFFWEDVLVEQLTGATA